MNFTAPIDLAISRFFLSIAAKKSETAFTEPFILSCGSVGNLLPIGFTGGSSVLTSKLLAVK